MSDAYEVLYHANVCNEMNIDYPVVLPAAKDTVTALEELRLALHSLKNICGRFAAVYDVPPLTILVCIFNQGPSVLWTHTFCRRDVVVSE